MIVSSRITGAGGLLETTLSRLRLITTCFNLCEGTKYAKIPLAGHMWSHRVHVPRMATFSNLLFREQGFNLEADEKTWLNGEMISKESEEKMHMHGLGCVLFCRGAARVPITICAYSLLI